jgi:two-component system phosphate regulon response regulator PhoB
VAISLGPLTVERAGARLLGRPLALRPLDLRVLGLLAGSPQRALTREAIAEHIWGQDATVDPRAIDVCVRRLRRAMDGAGHAIVTVRRVGYRLDLDLLMDAADA